MTDDIQLTGEILRRTAARLPDKTALVCNGQSLSYAEFDNAADRLANALLDLGLAQGAKVAIMSRNVPAYAISHFGAARSGFVLVHASTRYTARELAHVLNTSEAEALIVEAPFAAIAAEASSDAPALEHLILIDGKIASELPGAVDFDDFIAAAEPTPPEVSLKDTDAYAITFTGGTTGFPKGALVNHRARLISSRASVVAQNMVETDTAAVTTPLFHTAGLYVWFQPIVMCGQTCVLIPDWSPQAFFDAVTNDGITGAFLVPTQIVMLLNDPAFDESVFKRLRKITYGGSPMAPALNDEILQRFPDLELSSNYGQTEGCPLATFRVDLHPDRSASLGQAPAGIEVAVLDEQGQPVPPGEIGEIASRGDHLLTCYYRDPEQTADFFKGGDGSGVGGWGWTGDLGVMDDDGFISLVDRAKDMFISGGENIYPKEIENLLHSHPSVAECAVFGIDDEVWGEIGVAHVCLRQGIESSTEQLLQFCAENLARFKIPKIMKLVDELPKTAIGKIQKTALRDIYREEKG